MPEVRHFWARARPIPEAPPVMMAVLPFWKGEGGIFEVSGMGVIGLVGVGGMDCCE